MGRDDEPVRLGCLNIRWVSLKFTDKIETGHPTPLCNPCETCDWQVVVNVHHGECIFATVFGLLDDYGIQVGLR